MNTEITQEARDEQTGSSRRIVPGTESNTNVRTTAEHAVVQGDIECQQHNHEETAAAAESNHQNDNEEAGLDTNPKMNRSQRSVAGHNPFHKEDFLDEGEEHQDTDGTSLAQSVHRFNRANSFRSEKDEKEKWQPHPEGHCESNELAEDGTLWTSSSSLSPGLQHNTVVEEPPAPRSTQNAARADDSGRPGAYAASGRAFGAVPHWARVRRPLLSPPRANSNQPSRPPSLIPVAAHVVEEATPSDSQFFQQHEEDIRNRIIEDAVKADVVDIRKRNCCIAIVAILLLAVGILVGVFVGRHADRDLAVTITSCDMYTALAIGDNPQIFEDDYNVLVDMLAKEVQWNASAFDSCSPENLALWWWAAQLTRSSTDSKTLFLTRARFDLELTRFALASLFLSTYGLKWANNENWLNEESVCEWYGIECSAPGIEVHLNGQNLNGELPAAIRLAVDLVGIDVGGNQLKATIPTELGLLTSLKFLDLSNNFFEGGIPTELTGLLRLNQLNLAGNMLKGAFPSEMGRLTRLLSLVMHDNHLTGRLPPEMGQLSVLLFLSLGNNELSGDIPSSVGNLSNLAEFGLGNNRFTSIPSEITRISSLESFEIPGNPLNSTFPLELTLLTKLRELILSDAGFYGSIPSFLGSLTRLEWLDVANNRFEATVPSEIGLLVDLNKLNLANNTFTGQIPSEMGRITDLIELHIENNNLDGNIPKELGGLARLRYLGLQYNRLRGSIPASVGGLRSLVTMMLNQNALTGVIPGEIGSMGILEKLDLSNNRLRGTVPAAVMDLIDLESLRLSRNSLTGSIVPSSKPDAWRYLLEVFLDHNYFTGRLPLAPRWPELKNARFGSNQFSGSIPPGMFDRLVFLDVSHNVDVGGMVPTSIALSELRLLDITNTSIMGPLSQLCLLEDASFFSTNRTRIIVVGDNKNLDCSCCVTSRPMIHVEDSDFSF